MIIENTFTSISEIADQLYPFVKPVKDYLLRNFWHSDKLAPEIRVPVQYVTGDKDEIIPTVMTHQLYNLTTKAAFKLLYSVKNGEHNDSWYVGGRTYLNKINKFIIKAIKEYRPENFDNWAGGERADILEIEKDVNVKVKTTVMPPGSLDKQKER